MAIRRTTNANGCICYGEAIASVDGLQIKREIIKEIWSVIDSTDELQKYDDFIYSAIDKYEDSFYELESKVMPSTCQADLAQSIFLGPLSGMIKEAAIIHLLIQELNIKYYKPFVDFISEIVKSSGLVIALSDTLIICKK